MRANGHKARASRKDADLDLAGREARATLKLKKITVAERLKAIELLAKVAQIRHKIEDGADGSFFQ
jgi:hypothetical protein